jgi:hypothetical protein
LPFKTEIVNLKVLIFGFRVKKPLTILIKIDIYP